LIGFDGSKHSQLAFQTAVALMRPEIDTLYFATIHEKHKEAPLPTVDKPILSIDYHMKYCEDHKVFANH